MNKTQDIFYNFYTKDYCWSLILILRFIDTYINVCLIKRHKFGIKDFTLKEDMCHTLQNTGCLSEFPGFGIKTKTI